MTPDEFDALWKIDLDVADQPAGQVLERLAGELGLSFPRVEGQQGPLGQRVILRRNGCSRLEAIEEVCRQVGLHPAYEDHFERTRVVLRPGPRPGPAAFAGPFLVEVREVKQFPPHATGYVLLSFRAYGLPANLTERQARQAELEPVVNAWGMSLEDDGALYSWGSWSGSADVFQFVQAVRLKDLLRPVRLVAVQGYVPFRLPTRTDRVRFEPLAAGTTHESGKVSVTLSHVTEGEPCQLDFSLAGVSFKDVQLAAYDRDGKPLEVRTQRGFGTDDAAEVSVEMLRRPAAVEVSFIADTQELRYPFRLDAVPLPLHAEMPEVLPPAKFPGPAPVSVKFVAIAERGNSPRVSLEVTNHSDKPVRRLDLDLTYLDADGRPADEFPGPHSASVTGREHPVVVEAGATTKVVTAAFFMPPRTERGVPTVRRVEFADATSWRPGR
jgi:hypothetical protein